MLGSSFLWPNSVPPEKALADQATLIARDAAAQSYRDLITKGVTAKHNTNNPLTRFAHAS